MDNAASKTIKPVKHLVGVNGLTRCGLSVRAPGIRLTKGVNVPTNCPACKGTP
jgi:hypothetical protein